MEETRDSIEEASIIKLKLLMKNLYNIWDTMGIKNEKKIERCRLAWEYIIFYSEEMLKEESNTYNILLMQIEEFSKEISKLSSQLSMPCVKEVEGTLIMKEETLKKTFKNLRRIKEERIKKHDELRNVELKYCQILGRTPLKISSETGVPSEHDISELEQYITVLQEERNVRFQRLLTARRELTTILENTELQPETSFEKQILSCKEDTVSLTNETFENLDQFVQKVKTKKADLEKEKATLMSKLKVLYDRLGVPESEKNGFSSKHTDCKVSTLKVIKDKIEKYEEIERENIKKYICNMREELQTLWNGCFASEEEREIFSNFKTDEFTDENVQAHELEVDKWRKRHAKIDNICQKIKKRNELWDLLIVFENKASDPNRFKNRRGNLLKEEKDRKKLRDDLPALENDILVDIENYEAENGTHFLYFGEIYRDAVTKQWEDRKTQKENEKIMRNKKHMLQVENEATGSKRKLNCIPKSTPSKLLKSSLGVPVYRTPLVRANRNGPGSSQKNCLDPVKQKSVFK